MQNCAWILSAQAVDIFQVLKCALYLSVKWNLVPHFNNNKNQMGEILMNTGVHDGDVQDSSQNTMHNEQSLKYKASDRIGTDAGLRQADYSMDDRDMSGRVDNNRFKQQRNNKVQGYEQFDINDNLDTRSERAYTNTEKKSDYQLDESKRMES